MLISSRKTRWQRAIDRVKSFVTDKKDRSTTPPVYSIVTSLPTADGALCVCNGTSGMQFSTYLLSSNVHRGDVAVILYEYLNGMFFARYEAPMGGRLMHMVTEFVCNEGRTLWQQVDGDGRICNSSGV